MAKRIAVSADTRATTTSTSAIIAKRKKDFMSAQNLTSRLLRLIDRGRSIGRINLLHKIAGRLGRRLELARIFSSHRSIHKVHPDRQRSVRAGFFCAEG